VHLILAKSPWRQLRERAEKIPGDKKHDPEQAGFCHGVIASRSTIRHKSTASKFDRMDGFFGASDSQNAIKLPVAALCLRHPRLAMVDFPPILVANGLAENTRTNVPSRT
jgi:hypothetical protein